MDTGEEIRPIPRLGADAESLPFPRRTMPQSERPSLTTVKPAHARDVSTASPCENDARKMWNPTISREIDPIPTRKSVAAACDPGSRKDGAATGAGDPIASARRPPPTPPGERCGSNGAVVARPGTGRRRDAAVRSRRTTTFVEVGEDQTEGGPRGRLARSCRDRRALAAGRLGTPRPTAHPNETAAGSLGGSAEASRQRPRSQQA